MIEVIQIYKSIEVFEKSNYNPGNRKLFSELKESFESSTGFVNYNTLFLPLECKEIENLNSARLIFIMDVEGFNSYQLKNAKREESRFFMYSNDKVLAFQQYNKSIPVEFFRLKKNNNGNFELFLDYEELLIGIPKRENHKICEFGVDRSVRYKINGKSDFSMTAGKERAFNEFDYIFEHKGCVDNIEFMDLNKINRIKHIPITTAKLVNERKILR